MPYKLKGSKTRICLIATSILSLFTSKHSSYQSGGGEVQLFYLGTKLAENPRYQITYLVGDFGQDKIERYANVLLYRGVKPFFGIAFYKTIYAVIKSFYHFLRINSDIYIDRTASPRLGYLAIYCWLFRKKLIFMTAHEMDCSGEYENQNSRLFGWFYRFGLYRAHIIITQNQGQKEQLMKRYGLKSSVIKSLFVINKNKVKKKETILWVSRCSWWKNPDLFLTLVQRFPKNNFVMIAPAAVGENDLFTKIKNKARVLPNLVFSDGVPFKSVQHYFDEAKVFVNTSLYEGFPNTFFQAGLGHTPVLSLNVNPDNVLNVYHAGLCANGDFERLCDLLETLLQDSSLWEALSQGVFNYVQKNHDIDVIIKEYEDLLGKLVG